jgi:RimJ/RimL family protein N-acetyltransferase
MSFGWSGEKVRLVPIDFDRHFENCYRWINDPEVSQWLAVGDYPMARLAEKEWFEGAQKSNETEVTFAIETLDGRHIGQSGIHRINLRHGYAFTGSLIGDPNDRGQGYGTEAAVLRAWYCFHVLPLRMLFSEYIDGNDLSKRMQEKTGYVECGRRVKAFWKRGEHRDMVLTQLTRERFFEVNPAWKGRSG